MPTDEGMTEPIMTPRVKLRSWEPKDAPLLRAAIVASLTELQSWMTWAAEEPAPLAEIEARLTQFAGDFAAGRDWGFAVLDHEETAVLGGAGLHPRRGPGALEIGYWIHT